MTIGPGPRNMDDFEQLGREQQMREDKDDLPGMLAVAKGVAEQRWPHTMDAAVWAAEYVKRYPGSDEGEMLGWFANAIMAGYDTARARASAPSETAPATGDKSLLQAIHDRLDKVDTEIAVQALGNDLLNKLHDSLRVVGGLSAPSATVRAAWKRGTQRVVCAALRCDDGRIVTGARHFDAVMMGQIGRETERGGYRNAEQGFIDQFGTFLTREEARTVAEKQGQILEECGGNGIDLYSENLY